MSYPSPTPRARALVVLVLVLALFPWTGGWQQRAEAADPIGPGCAVARDASSGSVLRLAAAESGVTEAPELGSDLQVLGNNLYCDDGDGPLTVLEYAIRQGVGTAITGVDSDDLQAVLAPVYDMYHALGDAWDLIDKLPDNLTGAERAELYAHLSLVFTGASQARDVVAEKFGWPASWALGYLGTLARAALVLAAEVTESAENRTLVTRIARSTRTETVAALREAEATYLKLLTGPELVRAQSYSIVGGFRASVLGQYADERGAVLLHEVWRSWDAEDCPGSTCTTATWYWKLEEIWKKVYAQFALHRRAAIQRLDAGEALSSWSIGRQDSFLVNNKKGLNAPAFCLDAADDEPGTPVVGSFCNRSVTQKWNFVAGTDLLRQDSSGRCLDAAGSPASQQDGSAVVLADCPTLGPDGSVPSTHADQRWSLHPAGFLVNRAAGRCLDINIDNGRAARLEPCEDRHASMPGGRDAPKGIDGSDPSTYQLWHTAPVGEVRVELAGLGQGAVSSPAGFDCGPDGGPCRRDLDAGSVVTLTAEPVEGNYFAGWSGGCTGTAPTCQVRVDLEPVETITATFVPAVPVTVTLEGAGTGRVVSFPAGIDCPGTCEAPMPSSGSIDLVAEPALASAFGEWTGDCADAGEDPVCTLAVDQAKQVTGSFVSAPGLHVRVDGEGSVASDPAGIDCGEVCFADLPQGTETTLTATADPSSLFAGWSGACTGSGATCEVTISESTGVAARFVPRTPVEVTVKGSGSVASAPAGLSCGSGSCTHEFPRGAQVELTATPAPGHVFARWEGACGGLEPTCALQVDTELSATAIFATGATLTLARSGPGSIASNPAGIDCPGSCAHEFAEGTWVELRPIGEVLVDWSGDCEGAPGPRTSCLVKLDGDRQVTAEMRTGVPVEVEVDGIGRVFSGPEGIACGVTADGSTTGACTANFDVGSEVTLVAYAPPADGRAFGGWSGDCAGQGLTCTVTADQARTVTATFVDPARISVEKNGTGEGTVEADAASTMCVFTVDAPSAGCGFDVAQGRTTTLTAKAYFGSVFTGWGGACSGAAPTCEVTADDALTVTAGFAPSRYVRVQPGVGTGQGTVTSAPAGIDCPATCEFQFGMGVDVTLTATPAPGHRLTGWWAPCSADPASCAEMVSACEGNGSTCNLPSDKHALVVPIFDPVDGGTKRRVLLSVTGKGEVSADQTPLQGAFPCRAVCPSEYDIGTTVVLTANPGPGQVFTGWSGECQVDGLTCTVTGGPTSIVAASFLAEDEAVVENLTAPQVAGTAVVGKTLTASPGTWSPSGAEHAYQWLRDGAPIAGADGTTYTLTAADLGAQVAVEVEASKQWYTSGSATSSTVGPVAALGSVVGVRVAREPTTVRAGTAQVTVSAGDAPAGGQVTGSLLNGAGRTTATMTATLVNGSATLTLRPPPGGTYQLRVRYQAQGAATAGEATARLVVAKVRPGIAARVLRKPGRRTKGKVRIAVAHSGYPGTGRVAVQIRNARGKVVRRTSCSLRAGTTVCVLRPVPKGKYRMQVMYPGDPRFVPATRTARLVVRR